MSNSAKKYLSGILFLVLITLSISGCDKEVYRTPVSPPPPEGFIYVNSVPEGFAIYQNGRNTGRFTPDSLPFLETGEYSITLKKLYWKDTTVTVNVSEDNLSVVDIDLLANNSMFGDLIFFSAPAGAKIFLNDSLLADVTPDTLSHLLPGSYNVKYQLFNFRDEDFEAIVESSKKNLYSIAMRDTSVWVDYQVFNSGIPSNSLSKILVDQNGVKWIGSLDKGLIRYDEITFSNFNITNSDIPANKVNALNVDEQNRIWVGTDLGIGVFDNVSWLIYNNSNSGLTSNVINSIKFDGNGNTWIGTSSGLFKFDGVNWIKYNDAQHRVWAMDSEVDNNGIVWIGTREAGIAAIENNQLVFYPDSTYPYPTNRISSVTKDPLGNIWFSHMPQTGRRSGVSFWDGNMFNVFFLGTANNNVNHIFIDSENNKWISTWEGFVWYDAQNNFQTFNSSNTPISSDKVQSAIRDNNGIIWLTTAGGGLNKFKVNNLK